MLLARPDGPPRVAGLFAFTEVGMAAVAMLCVVVAFICFLLGAAGVAARVSWDQAGKAALVAALLAQWGRWGL